MILSVLNKYLSAKQKEKILRSLPFRCYSRMLLKSHEIRFSCELTTKCNVACDMCTRADLLKRGELDVKDMPEEIIGRILEEMSKFLRAGRSVYFVPMGLGEPLLFKGLFDVFQRVKRVSEAIGIVLVTNGVLLDEKAADDILDGKINEVCVSFNAYNKNTYKQHMKLDAHENVRKNIENFIRKRNKRGLKTPSLFIQFIDYDMDLTLFNEEIRRWRGIFSGRDKYYIHPVVNQAGLTKAGNFFKNKTKNYPCSQPLWRVAVKVNGDMYPCDPALYSGAKRVDSLFLGNILSKSPFEIFNSKDSQISKIIRAMRKDEYLRLPECEKCNTYKLGCNCFFELPEILRFKGYRWI